MQLSHYMKYRPLDSVQNIFENYAEFPRGHIMQQKRKNAGEKFIGESDLVFKYVFIPF